jgi:hypothetical protein
MTSARTNSVESTGADQETRRLTLRELIALVVADEVAAFNVRQQEQRLPRVLTREQMQWDAERGRIAMGGRDRNDPTEAGVVSVSCEVSADVAVATALQAFEDRLYLVLLDGSPIETLDAKLELRPGARLTFVRLVALVGG